MYFGNDGGLGALSVVDHIPAQNQAGADLASNVSRAAAMKQLGTLTIDAAQQLANEARAIGARFATFARGLHNSRADKGASEIETLANNIANGHLAAAQSAAVNTPLPPQQVTIQDGGVIPAITGAVSTITHEITRVLDGGNGNTAPPDGMFPPAGNGLPEWALPAAAVVALVWFMRR